MDHSTHHGSIYIPDHEYLDRVQKAAALLRREGLDAMIVNGTESDYANPRYFSGYCRCLSARAWQSPPAATRR